MSDPIEGTRDWRERATLRLTVRPIWFAVVLSILVHVAVLWRWLPKLDLGFKSTNPDEHIAQLDVVLAPRSVSTPPPAAAVPAPAPAEPVRPPLRPAERAPRTPTPRPPPPVVAKRTPAPSARAVPAPTVQPAPPTPALPAPAGDLASYIEARRRARENSVASASPPSAPSPESDAARANRALAASLAADQRSTRARDDPNHSGGVFSMRRVGYDSAEFVFYGWSNDAHRDLSQLVEVRLGNSKDIQTAIVRKMIEIIRNYEQGDFQWESRRLGRTLTLSAAPRDTSGLEAFLLKEFF